MLRLAFSTLLLSQSVIAITYDYVIIGGGPGGLTVASRLAENKSINVAVLEAGPYAEDLPEVYLPALLGTGQAYITLDWAYETVPQVNLNNRTLTVNAGKALGGGTVINAMFWTRAGKEQYDAWGKLNNDNAWTWLNLLPYFERSENASFPTEFQSSVGQAQLDSQVHGFNGRVKGGFPNFFFPQSEIWRNAAASLGFSITPDLCNGNPHAVGVAEISVDNANNTRCDAVCGYYAPLVGQSNFNVITNAKVTRIVWSNESPNTTGLTASGVEYISGNQTLTLNATREVILAAGTIGSPRILELSGVGNKTILESAGVQPVLELPTVGENLADHVHSWANAFTNASITVDVLSQNLTFASEQLELWYQNRTGLYAGQGRSLGLTAPSDLFTAEELDSLLAQAEANISYYANQFANGNPELAKGIQAQFEIAIDLYRSNKQLIMEYILGPQYQGPTAADARPARNYTSINSSLYAPLSRGRTHIVSPNISEPSAVDPAYWSHPLDVAAQVSGLQLSRRMLRTPPMDSIYNGEYEPGNDNQTDAKVEDWLRSVVASDNHVVGTLPMLPRNLGGVVDTTLKVYNITNVRVSDASIFPMPISAHLQATVYMIGEKAAEMIKADQLD